MHRVERVREMLVQYVVVVILVNAVCDGASLVFMSALRLGQAVNLFAL